MEPRKNGLVFKSKSGQLTIELDDDIIICSMGNMKAAGVEEYLNYISEIGNFCKEIHSGKMLADITYMTNYDISTRAAAINSLPNTLFSKVPYFVVACVKGKSLFENLSMQAALALAKPLSKKFLDGKLFETKAEALDWLKGFSIPAEFIKTYPS